MPIKKLAVIRKNDAGACPFGLSIPNACQNVGDVIKQLVPLSVAKDDEQMKQEILEQNKRLMRHRILDSSVETKPCVYAGKIIEQKNAVECNFGDSAPGVPPADLLGTPFYNQIMQGVILNGLYTYPIGYYADYNLSRNLFYGIYSLQGGSPPVYLEKMSKAENSTHRGAGALFICPDDKTVLLFRRSDGTNQSGSWDCPGGSAEKGEHPAETAFREGFEEIGEVPRKCFPFGAAEYKDDDGETVVTFFVSVPKETKESWEPSLNWEHDEWGWFEIDDLPEPMHRVTELAMSKLRELLTNKMR